MDTTRNCIESDAVDISKSVILAPFNSLVKSDIDEDISDLVADKKIIKFKSKLREYDRRYERDNNSKIDNGMYVKAQTQLIKNLKGKFKGKIYKSNSKKGIHLGIIIYYYR